MIESYMGPTAAYAGSNSERQSVGLPGHCVTCAEHGHVAVEAKMTLDVARRRHDLVKGLDPDALIAAAGSVSLYDAAVDIVTEHQHIEQVLNSQHR